MRAVAFSGPGDAKLVDAPVPTPAPGEALVRVEASAICGGELHTNREVLEALEELNPGHEAAGIVEESPRGSGVQPGERVGISAVTGCGTCDHCRLGVQLYCANGTRIQIGMHAEYVAVPIAALRRLPQTITPRDAVLVTGDTLGVPVRALRRVPSQVGERILVLGLGPIGLGHTLVRVHAGAEVIAIEPSDYRRGLGRALGAAHVLPPDSEFGSPTSLIIECTGLPECIQMALAAVATGGTVLQSGECPTVEFSPSDQIVRREITYTGAWYYADQDFPEMLRLYEEGLPLERMVTHEFPAEQVAEAYECFISKRSGKVVLNWI